MNSPVSISLLIRQMHNHSRILILFFGLILFDGCITSYEPEITKYNNLLVVDGFLTNLPGTSSVILSRTYPYDQRHKKPEKNAIVKITDDLGNVTVLTENGYGTYLPDNKDFVGKIGSKYKLSVTTSGGEICESEFEELKEPVSIGKLYYQIDNTSEGFKQLNLFVDANDPLKKSIYYSWDYIETWEFSVPYASQSAYLPESKICYNDVISRKILIESTRDYIEDRVIKFPLYSVTNSSNRLSIKYSVLVRQYVLTEKTYEFYKNLKNINENKGTLFDATPVILTGNMLSISSPGQPILGNFQVSGASEKRIFIHREELPANWNIPTEYEFCKGDLLDNRKDRHSIDSLLQKGWAIMDTVYSEQRDTLIGMVNSRSCFDCTTKGKIQRPGFWDEN